MSHIIARVASGALVVALGAAACRPRGGPAAVTPTAGECAVASGVGAVVETVTVALTDPLDPGHAPRATNDAERLVFRQLYEPLIRLDCRGRVTPALAESWSPADGGRRWSFVLRAGARFWDGSPVTAEDVRASWAAVGGGLDERVTLVSDRVLSVQFAEPQATIPLRLADAALAVSKRVGGLGWPIGTGSYWLAATDSGTRALPAFGDPLPVLAFRVGSGADPRDVLDAGVDLLVTGDRAALAYAATRPEFEVVPLPWDRVYVLVTAPGVTVPDGVRASLAEAVRVDARPAESPFWWSTRSGCHPVREAPLPPAPATRRIAFVRSDRIARDLAERLVAVGVGDATAAAGMRSDDFATALKTGTAAAYLLGLPRSVLDACGEYGALRGRAPWPIAIAPLVDIRRRAVLRRGAVSLVADWDGAIRVRPAP